MEALRMCLNWKVLAGLATVGAGVYVLAPQLMAEALPVLLLAACPLSMLLMMWSMQRTRGQDERTTEETNDGMTREERIARLRAQQAALADRIGELEREEARPAENGRRR